MSVGGSNGNSSGRLRQGATAGRFVPLGRLIIVFEALVALAFVLYLLGAQGVEVPFVSTHYTVTGTLDDAAGLKTQDTSPVTVAGVQVGEVKEVTTDGGRAVVTMDLDDEMRGRIRSDADISVVPRSALNDRIVALDPGTGSAPLARSARIQPSPGATPVGADQVIGVLDADTRAQLQVLLGELRVGLDGRSGDVARGLERLGAVADTSVPVAAALADRRELLSQLVRDLDVIFRTLGERGDQLAAAVHGARGTLDVTSARGDELDSVVRQLPSTLASVQGALDQVRELSGPLNPALDRLRPVARELPGGLDALRDFVPSGRALLDDAGPLIDDGAGPLRDLRGVAKELGPAARDLRSPIADAGTVVEAIDDNKEGVAKLGDNFSGVFSTNDANGPILRGLGAIEPFRPENFGVPGASGAKLAQLKQDAVKALVKVCFKDNALACLMRYLVPGLPDAVRTVGAPLGSARLARLEALQALRGDGPAPRGVTPR